MIEQLLTRNKELLGFFWRALAPVPVANLVYTLATRDPDPYLYLRCALIFALLARFSFGNYNYALSTFAAGPAWDARTNPAHAIRTRFAWDAVLYASQLSALIGMALLVTRTEFFTHILEIFLLADSLFLLFDRHAWPVRDRARPSRAKSPRAMWRRCSRATASI